MIEAQVEVVPKILQRPLRVSFIGEEGIASLNLREPRRLAEPLQPRFCKLLGLLVLFRIEEMETVVVVIILSAGDELSQARRAILGQREVLNVTDLAGRRRRDHENCHRRPDQHALHCLCSNAISFLPSYEKEASIRRGKEQKVWSRKRPYRSGAKKR